MDVLDPSASRVEDELARILNSPQFRESPRLQSFLRFIVTLTLQGRAGEIKESTIAAEVFGRPGSADDSIVRSAARRLRARLQEYYEGEGAADSIYIQIQKGSYVPEVRERDRSEQPSEAIAALPEKPPRRSMWRWFVAGAAVLALAGAIGFAAFHRPAPPQPASEAQDLYLKGRYYWEKRTPEALNRSIDYYTQAVVRDPHYARAFAGLADSYNLLSEYSTVPYRESFRRAVAAAKTALTLDDGLAEAHSSLAYASFYGDWNADLAEREFRRALSLNPDDSRTHHWFATFLMAVGRESEALSEIQRAQTLDPASKAILADKGVIELWAGHADAAGSLLREISLADPQFLSPHTYLAYVYLLQGRFRDYLTQLESVAALSQNKSLLQVTEAGESGLRAGGPPAMLQKMIDAGERSPADHGSRYFWMAQLSAVAGHKEAAIRYLNLAFTEHETVMVTLTADPCFASLRKEPAFQSIVRRVGLTASPAV